MEDKNKKKILIGSIIIVITLILVIVGTTYAFFALEITGNNTNSTVHITTGEASNIELTGKLENYHIRINASDMAYSKKNSEYYGTDTEDNYVETKEDGTKIIGTLKVNGTLKEENKCSAKVNVSLSGNMEPQENDLELTIINDQFIKTIDLSKLEENNPVELEFILQDNIPNITQTIKAYLLLRNQDKDQSYLANKTLSVSIKIEDLKCTNDTTSPIIEEFYIKDKTNKYTNQIENTAHLTWSDSDVTEYCITETEGSNNCTWKTVQGNSATETITLSAEEGEHKYYAYLKDEANNISTGNMYDTITYDITNPILNTFYIKDTNVQKYTNNNKNTVYFTYNETNADKVCVTEGTDSSSCNWQDASNNIEYTFTNTNEEAKTIRGYVKDKAGNISTEVKTDSITYDKTSPTIQKVEAPTIAYNSITISVTPNTDLSGVSEYCYATAQAGPYTCKSGNTNSYNSLQAGTEYTFWIYLKDRAGNGTEGNATQHKIKTANKPIKDYLQEKGGNTFKLQSGMYRFVGTKDQVTHNYICFGTDNTETCKGNTWEFMYRIIGVTSSDDNTLGLKANQLKLIKARHSGAHMWHYNIYTDTKWDYSDMKTYLNGTNSDQFLGAVQWESPSYWKGLITSQKWYNVDQPSDTMRPGVTAEPTDSTTASSKIGLMYATDYVNAFQDVSTSNWLYIANGWTGNVGEPEWTMSRIEYYMPSGRFTVWEIFSGGYLTSGSASSKEGVRPVFYVSPNITLTGEGTTADPFIIHS